MSSLGLFRRKKEETKVTEKAKPEEETLLKQLCGDDLELYEVLSRTILLNPAQAVKAGIDSYIQRAAEFEQKGDTRRARIMYQMAGELALYEGKTNQVQAFFKKCADTETNPEMKKTYEFYTRKRNLDKAMKVAKEYYTRTSAPPEKKE